MEVRLRLSEGQRKKLSEAAAAGTGCTIQLTANDYHGDHILRVPGRSALKIAKSMAEGKGMRLVLSKKTVTENKKVIGGWLPLLAGLAGALAPGLIGSIFGSSGEGLHVHGAPPVVGHGMFGGSRGQGMREEGDGMFTHGSAGHRGTIAVPMAVGEGVKKKRSAKRKNTKH